MISISIGLSVYSLCRHSSSSSRSKEASSQVTTLLAQTLKKQFISSMQAAEACAPADGDALRAAIAGDCVAITLGAGE